MFKHMILRIVKLVDTNCMELSGLWWLSICHEVWNTITMDGIFGSSIRLTTKEMETYTTAAILEKKNVSHTAYDVGAQLQRTYMERFGVNLMTEGTSVASNTCKAASNVAGVLDADGQYCEMHIISLVMGYSFGVKKNTKTRNITDDQGVVNKVQSIVAREAHFGKGRDLSREAESV